MKIASIFKSINGEVCKGHQGSVCGFIRLAGCNCSCQYCDTKKFQKKDSGIDMNIDEIIKAVQILQCQTVTITGGEPLVQKKSLLDLIAKLYQTHHISIETNGSIEIPISWRSYVDSFVIDYKCSSSGMKSKMKLKNYINARYDDFIKFVIADRKDFDDAVALIKRVQKQRHDYFLLKWCFSPMFINVDFGIRPFTLFQWINEEPLLKAATPIINVQIHKMIEME